MKNYNNFLIIMLVSSVAFSFVATGASAQAVAPTSNMPVTVGANPPVKYLGIKNLVNTGKFNYVRTIIPDVPSLNNPSSNSYYRQNTEYYDGLGRPLQSVGRKSHAEGFDIVAVHVYDSVGRETYQYQPFAGPKGPLVFNGSYGTIKFNDSTQMRKFYEDAGRDEQPFSQNVFEPSPLGRVVKSMPPGAIGVGSNKGTTYDYITNTNWSYNNGQNVYVLTGGFPIWSIANTPGALPINTGQYAQGQLHITIVTDADGKSVMEVTDKQGKVVMRLANLTQNAWGSTRPTDYAYTIYIYDDVGRLRCVLPPEVAKPTGTTGNFTWSSVSQQVMDGLCYSYVYDNRNRVVEKKNPGKAIEYFVYDKRDRMVLSQDGNLRIKQKWQYAGYDAMDRLLWTGLYGKQGIPEDRATLQSYLDNTQIYTEPSLFYYLKKYDMIDVSPLTMTDCEFLSFTNYDHYGDDMSSFDASQFTDMIPANNILAVPSNVTYIARGLPTKTANRLLDPETGLSDKWIYKAIYYDGKARPIQTLETNIIGGKEVSSNVYYFQGQLYKNKLKHHDTIAVAIPGTNDGIYNDYTLINTYERNFGIGKGNDLVKKHTQRINDGPDYELSSYEYDHLGRNTLKQWTAGLNLREYNIGGMINHIAFREYNQDTVFNENLYYHKGFASKLYNGNIAGITWWGKDHVQRAYGYTYDNLNRLIHAEFNQYNGAWNKSQGVDLTASNITYDLNGNILSMNQMGRLPSASTSIPMDILNYKYAPNSNLLYNVKDGVSPSVTAALPDFKDDGNNNANTVEEYHYDNNGNLVWDLNKKISSISYNHLNRPSKITVDGKGSIAYTYDAAGTRIRKVIVDAVTSTTEKWDYAGDLVYKNNELQYILNDEGRSRPTAAGHDQYADVEDGMWETKFVYDYFVKDHLGNVRSTVNSKPNSYPYLAMHNISTANIEELIFDNIQKVRDTKPGSTNPDDMAARLNGGEPEKRIGTAIMLRTNPGDRFSINVNAFYDGEYKDNDEPVSPNVMMEALMGTLLGGSTIGPRGLPLEKLPENQALISSIFSNPALAGQVDQILNVNTDPNAPKAHLNYLWFDDKMQLQPAFSGSVQVATVPNNWNVISAVGSNSGLFGTVTNPGVFAPGVGVLIVYIDNQTIGKDVWFDNLSLNMYESEVTEEDHYYPFGLALNTFTNSTVVKNPSKYNSMELESHFGLQSYETLYRDLDPQLGRFNQVDPKAELTYNTSPYATMMNNPTLYVDPLGDQNTIYLVNLPGSGMSGADMKKQEAMINKAFKELGVNIIASVFTGDGPLDKSLLDATDGVAIYGDAKSVTDYAKKNFDQDLDESQLSNSNNPEQTKGRVIGLNSTSFEEAGKPVNSSKEEMGAFLTMHGTGHIANKSAFEQGHLFNEGGALLWPGYLAAGKIRGKSYLDGDVVRGTEKDPGINSVKDLQTKARNGDYIQKVNKYFDSPNARANYNWRVFLRNNGLSYQKKK
jgi:RHS repeat-associated protein